MAPQEADVNQKRAAYELSMRKLDDLRVKAGMTGVLQLVSVERGAQVSPGTNLVRVADPTNLKAEVRIAETQTKDLRLGQFAEIDTRNGIVAGQGVAHRSGIGQRNRRRGRHPRWRAAAGRPAGPERRRHHPDREAGQRDLRRPSGVRPGRGQHLDVQADAERRGASAPT